MRILSISACNYRTLHSIEIPFPKGYCTISGRNNAGKSCIIRLLLALFRRAAMSPWMLDEFRFYYREDKTQWHKPDDPIQVKYALELNTSDDPALISFIEKITANPVSSDVVTLQVRYEISVSDEVRTAVLVNDSAADNQAAKEIVKKVMDSNLMFLHNSATRHEEIYYGRGRGRMFYEVVMSEDEKKELAEAGKQIERRLRRLAREHKAGLNSILGRLSEKYDVEFSPLEGYDAGQMPLGINLRDKSVEVPLSDWGSGTQNRTHILMALLQANRIKTTESPQDRITPIVVIEEPESFLHPSAQSEFGRVLRTLSVDLGIQIVVTTHSPYMLNQEDPSSNILLTRQCRRGKLFQTTVVDTSGANWMAPFSEHLGIAPAEFVSLRPVFSSYKSRVLLVEGSTDKEYFEFLQRHQLATEQLSKDIEVVAYGGKDTLKNTLLIQFVLGKFDEVFITYDLDAKGDVEGTLKKLGLREGQNYLSVGVAKAGREAIEGLLPERVLATVNGRETDLVMRLGSKDNRERREAKESLKNFTFR